ncbi:hypothetical protein [Paraflavitalea speifideaquila]|uniref:hypothetical protein n=1 Tax=Paraflavitalea speifideaquila TaxID=3076558 RepID=UPI0028EA164C|nr:hypothetical protein [Paraflavitalea speifideiaquila]
MEELPPYYHHLLSNGQSLESIPLVGKNGNDKHPFVLFQNRLYLQRYFRYETGFLQRIRQFLAEEKEQLPQRLALLRQHQTYISQLFHKTAPGALDSRTIWPTGHWQPPLRAS